MPSTYLSTRSRTWPGLIAGATASIAMLSGVMLLFAESGHTPWFRSGTRLSQQVARCPSEAEVQARQQCLRDVAEAASRETDVALQARGLVGP